MDFREERITDLAARVRSGDLSARELTATALTAIDERNGALNAFVAVDGDAALAQADAVDQRVAKGDDVGPLAGIPLGVKDLEDAEGFVTTHGSVAHADDAPASRDSTLVARLRAAGCVIVGKTNTPEFGWKADTDNQVFGPTHNPWNLERSAGGSSGGTGAAVAGGLVPLATGSDGGGSIRIPSALNGLSGLKPSLGRIPAGGPEPPGWINLSTSGPMARSIHDVAFALDCCVGPDPGDIRSLPLAGRSWAAAIAEPEAPMRIAWCPTLGYATVDGEVLARCRAAVDALADLGTEIVEVDAVFPEDPALAWLSLAYTYNLRSLDQHRDTDMWGRIDPGLVSWMEWSERHVGALEIVRAEDRCHELNQQLVDLFGHVSHLLCPTVAGQTPLIGQAGTIDGEPNDSWVAFTYAFNMTRSPAGTVPVGLTGDGMPVGLQVIGPQHADIAVLRLLALLEQVVPFEHTASAV